ncbi:metallophosphoesterase [Cohnella herbarum]|uniref:Metallophosphoesterase n=1 Tax=Cohnella herbarum TaxID=2728023 RepID=A0A7Z2VMP9_9BACL|nr:metallophosphoesterase [Cohnella herbarum]QJD85754.1 metallophosphoesterase [Cohnella herbarum]
MFVLFAILALIVYGFLVFYIGWSGWRWMKPREFASFKTVYIVAIVFLALSFVFGRLLPDIAFLSMIGSYWIAIFALLVMLLPIVHVILWLLRLTPLPRHRAQKWAGFLTLAALVALIGYGTFNAYSPVVRAYDVNIDKDVQGLDKLNVVMVADTHFGLLSGPSHARRMVEEINKLEPDIVLYPGDIIDDNLDAYLDSGIDDIISEVKSKYGVYATLGNHDKLDGPVEKLIEALERSNMNVLYDETITIMDDKLTLIGRKDRTETDRSDVAALVNGVDVSRPMILLDHQPYDLDIAAQNGIDLMVSGHTHRGQIAPGHLLTRALYENDWGHVRKGSFHSIVTSGYGFWGPPIRIGSRSEIVRINLTFSSTTG